MKPKTLLAAGGDLRQLAAAASLAKDFAVCALGFPPGYPLPPGVCPDDGTAPDALLLPLPASPDGIHLHTPLFPSAEISVTELAARLRPGSPVLGGRMQPELTRALADMGCIPLDYAKQEAFAVRNAVPTAEGAIAIAMRELPVTLCGTRTLLLGAGRLTRALIPRLRGLGAEVTVAARRCFDLARREGCKETPLRIRAIIYMFRTQMRIFRHVFRNIIHFSEYCEILREAEHSGENAANFQNSSATAFSRSLFFCAEYAMIRPSRGTETRRMRRAQLFPHTERSPS